MRLTAERIIELVEADDGSLERALKAELIPLAVEAIRSSLQPVCYACKRGGQRWAVNAVLKIAKLIDSQPSIVMAFMQRLGAKDEADLSELVAAGRSMRQLQNDATASLEDFRDEGVELLALVLREKPEWRASVLARLGSEVRLIEEGGTS